MSDNDKPFRGTITEWGVFKADNSDGRVIIGLFDGQSIRTSYIQVMDLRTGDLETVNSCYKLA